MGEEESKTGVGPFDVGKVEKEIYALSNLRKRKPRLFWSIVVIIAFSVGLNVFDRVAGIPKLADKNRELEEQNRQYKDENLHLQGHLADANAEVNKLQLELTPFRTIALQNYGGDEKSALAKLAKQVAEVRTLATRNVYQPLDKLTRSEAVDAFRSLKNESGTNLVQIRVVAEAGNQVRNKLAEEWISVLSEAGLNAVDGGMSSGNTTDAIHFYANADDLGLLKAFYATMAKLAMAPADRVGYSTNRMPRSIIVLDIAGEPWFSTNGIVEFH